FFSSAPSKRSAAPETDAGAGPAAGAAGGAAWLAAACDDGSCAGGPERFCAYRPLLSCSREAIIGAGVATPAGGAAGGGRRAAPGSAAVLARTRGGSAKAGLAATSVVGVEERNASVFTASGTGETTRRALRGTSPARA